jgi:hypothetical protein
MRKIFGIFVLVLFTTTTFALAEDGGGKPEGHDDHNDAAPVQSGYAVVTPSDKATSGLIAFETFGLREGDGGASQAGVLPPGLTTSTILFVESSGRLSKNLGVSIVNPNSSSVDVKMTLHKSDGTQLGTATVSVPSHQQVSKFVTELFSNQSTVPSDFTGTLTVTSDGTSPLPIAVIGLRFRGPNFSALPVTNLSAVTTALPQIGTGIGGDGAILLPQFAAGGGWATEIVIGNTGTSSLTVRLDLFKSDGKSLTATLNGQSAGSFPKLTIPPGGVITLAPRDGNGDDDF